MSAVRLAALSLALLSVAVLTPDRAAAYCRLTTDQPAASMCPEPCVETGIPVAWKQTEISYALNDVLLPDLPEADTRRILDQAFSAWTDAPCAEGPMNIELIQEEATTALDQAGHEDQTNLVLYRSQVEWKAVHPFRDRAFALTQVWFRTDSGEIVGADMELNGGLGAFAECPSPEGCRVGGQINLANVMTHEVGHFLGLAHSDVEESTMSCDAEPWAINKRSLHEDDIAGICTIYAGPDAAFFEIESSVGQGGCTALPPLGPPGTRGWSLGLFAFGAGLLWRRRHRTGACTARPD